MNISDRTAKYDSRVWSAYTYIICMQLSTFYIPLISHRIKDDSYLFRSTAIHYWHFSIPQSFFTVPPHNLERTDTETLLVS